MATAPIKENFERLQAYFDASGLTSKDISARSGVPYPTVVSMRRRGWRGTIGTLLKIERIIPPDWQVGDPAPDPNLSNIRATRKEAA